MIKLIRQCVTIGSTIALFTAANFGNGFTRRVTEPCLGSRPTNRGYVDACVLATNPGDITSKEADPSAKARAGKLFGELPLSFQPNQGQYDAKIRFAAHLSGCSLAATRNGLAISFPDSHPASAPPLQTPSAQPARLGGPVHRSPLWSRFSPAVLPKVRVESRTVRLNLIGANPNAAITGEDRLPGLFNYVIGNDRSKWRMGVPSYGRIRTSEIYGGIDLTYYGNRNKLEYDFVIHPGASPSLIKMGFPECSRIRVDRNGDLVVSTPRGEVRQTKPDSYQFADGQRIPVASAYRIREGAVTFRLGRYDRSREVIIDPVLAYSTLLGGSEGADGDSIAVDSAGNAYVTGANFSNDFPVVNQGQSYPSNDIFVSKLNAEGTALVYSTVMGGTFGDVPSAIAVDTLGSAYITGYTFSSDFPTVNPLQAALNGEIDGFVTKLSPDGSSLAYSTYLGGSGLDYAHGIAVDQSFNAIVAGETLSRDFPAVSAVQSTKAGTLNGFVSKLNASGSALVFSTYIGGGTNDGCSSVAVDASGNVYVTGAAQSPDFPLLNSIQPGFAATTLVKTADGAKDWQSSTNGLPPNVGITSLIVDPKDSSIMFAGTIGNGVFRSQDSGATWSQVGAPAIASVSAMAIDPVSPSNLFLSQHESTDIWVSTDGGSTWAEDGSAGSSGIVTALAADPSNPGIILAVTGGGLSKGGIHTPEFVPVFLSGFAGDGAFQSIATSPVAPGIILLGGQRAILESGVDGQVWGQSKLTDALSVAIASKSVFYAGTADGILKSTDVGATWTQVLLTGQPVTAIAPAPGSTKVVYAAISSDGLIKSTNGGKTWSPVNDGLSAPFVNTIAVSPSNTSVVYAGSQSISHPFIVKLSPSGALLFSTLLGGEGYDAGLSIAADNAGNAWLTGFTFSKSFPMVNAIQPANAGSYDAFVAKISGSIPSVLYSTYYGGGMDDTGESIAAGGNGNVYIGGNTLSTDLHVVSPAQPASGGSQDAFILALNPSGAVTYSTYLGGQFPDGASSIAVDGDGNAYLTGFTLSSNFPTTPGVLKTMLGQEPEGDAFIAKVAAPANSLAISSASVSGNALTVYGEQFDNGAVVLVNGQLQKTRNDSTDPTTKLVAKKAGKLIPVGTQVMLQVQDAGGNLSPGFPFTR